MYDILVQYNAMIIIILGYIDDIKLRALIVCLVTVEGEIIIFISDWQFKYDFMAFEIGFSIEDYWVV